MSEQLLNKVDSQYVPAVLLVDDEANVLSSLRRLFRKVDCEIIIANSGQEGLEKLKENRIDVIVSDARMPEMTGPEFLAIAAKEYPDTERILLTGYADMQATIDAINLGRINHYIEKPWDDEKLVKLVKKSLSVIELRKQNEQLRERVAEQNEELKAVNESLEEKVEERTKQLQESHNKLQESYRHTVDLFAHFLDQRQHGDLVSSQYVLTLVRYVAEILGMNKKEQAPLYYATKLRYLGQLSMPDELISIPIEDLNKEQLAVYEQYPSLGSTLLMSIPPLKSAANVIAQHKEYLNGKGFPNKDFGEHIDRSSQILAVVNDYIELISGRLQSQALTPEEAVRFIEARQDDYYAPDIVDALKTALKHDLTEQAQPETLVWSKQLQPGMVLSRDVLNENGSLLLTKGTLLEQDIIDKLIDIESKTSAELSFYVMHTE